MAETTGSVGCYGCDGKIKKSSEKGNSIESKIESNTVNQGQLKKTDLVEEFSEMPSHPTSKDAQSHIFLDVTDTLAHLSLAIVQSITVGDRFGAA